MSARPSVAEALSALCTLAAFLAPQDERPEYIYSRDPELPSKTGETRRTIETACRRGDLAGTRTPMGWRVDGDTLRAWQRVRTERRRKARTGARRREPPPANDVDEIEVLLGAAGAAPARRRA